VAFAVLVGKGNFLGMRLKEEVEGIDHRHLGDQIDLDPEFAGLFREDQARQVIALRVLLPVDEVLFRTDLQRIGKDACPRMRTRTQANDLRPEIDQAIVVIVRDVIQCDVDGHRRLLRTK
jgi:hypothetical protein